MDALTPERAVDQVQSTFYLTREEISLIDSIGLNQSVRTEEFVIEFADRISDTIEAGAGAEAPLLEFNPSRPAPRRSQDTADLMPLALVLSQNTRENLAFFAQVRGYESIEHFIESCCRATAALVRSKLNL